MLELCLQWMGSKRKEFGESFEKEYEHVVKNQMKLKNGIVCTVVDTADKRHFLLHKFWIRVMIVSWIEL